MILEKLTVLELKEKCKRKKIKGYSRMCKNELIKVLDKVSKKKIKKGGESSRIYCTLEDNGTILRFNIDNELKIDLKKGELVDNNNNQIESFFYSDDNLNNSNNPFNKYFEIKFTNGNTINSKQHFGSIMNILREKLRTELKSILPPGFNVNRIGNNIDSLDPHDSGSLSENNKKSILKKFAVINSNSNNYYNTVINKIKLVLKKQNQQNQQNQQKKQNNELIKSNNN